MKFTLEDQKIEGCQLFTIVHGDYPHLLNVPLFVVDKPKQFYVDIDFIKTASIPLSKRKIITYETRPVPAIEVEVAEHKGFTGPNTHGIGKQSYYRKNELTGFRFHISAIHLTPWPKEKR